jgi:hypothetical protein
MGVGEDVAIGINHGKDAQSVDYSRLTALLIEATKEQHALIRGQQEQIKVQQRQISRLTSKVRMIQASFQSSGGRRGSHCEGSGESAAN